MADTFLTPRDLEARLGIATEELREVAGWGLAPRPGEPGVREHVFDAWIDVASRYPGVFLSEKQAAALVGLSAAELRRRTERFEEAKTSFDERLYWKHRIDAIYRRHLSPDTIYGSLVDSHLEFAKRLDVRLAACNVCGEKAVSSVCESCGGLVDPAHCEAVEDDRPLPFRPAEVCFNCIRDKGPEAFRFIRDRRSVRASVERAVGPLGKR